MRIYLFACGLVCLVPFAAPFEARKAPSEPRLSSIHPYSGTVGKTYRAVIRGKDLSEARILLIGGEGVRGRVLDDSGSGKDSVHVEITSESNVAAGPRKLRLLTANGVTNELEFLLSGESVLSESEVPDPVRSLPLVVSGAISQRGETDSYWVEVGAGQMFTVQTKSGHPSLDPLLRILKRAPSWLDPNHLEQVAFNDEPLFFPGLATDAHLVHRFSEAGRYCIRIESASGQGSADSVYELRISEGASRPPALHPKLKQNGWDERQFTRGISADRQQVLAKRGALPDEAKPFETYRAARLGSDEIPSVMKLPGIVEGRITSPAEAHRIKIRIEQAENIAIEIQTPEATMPRFNPVILLFEPGGAEVATNVYTKRNNNGLYMMKMIQPKIAVPLHAPGEYEMEIRDITTDCAGQDFRYRVLVRRQIPHIGKIDITEDQINLRPGATREVNITIEREEGYSGLVVFNVEGAPAGVSVLPAAPKPIDKPPLPNGGKLERYTPIVQNSALIFMAAPDANPSTSASTIRIMARPVLNGKLGEPILVKELPLTIVPESIT
jgi:hypothetical protein